MLMAVSKILLLESSAELTCYYILLRTATCYNLEQN